MQRLWRTVQRFLKKKTNLEIKLPYDPAIPIPHKTEIQKDTCPPMFTAASFTIVKTWTRSKCPSTNE